MRTQPTFTGGRIFNRVLREGIGFLRNATGSMISVEFARVAVPLLVLWEVLPRLEVLPPALAPTPSLVAVTFWELLREHGLLGHLGWSLGRFALGFVVALLFAVPIGVLMGWNVFIRKHCLPLFQILAPVPPPAWVPLTLVVIGVGLPMQVFLIFLGVFYPVLFNTYQGVKETDPRYVASARVFGASEFTIIRHVHVWHAMGSIVMGVKIGIAMGLVMLVIAEMYGGRTGIGYLLVEAKDYFQIDRMVVCMVVLGGMGWFLIEVMKYVELKLSLWRTGR